MPLQKSCSLEAYRANIGELIKAGHEADQAVAIAHKTLRESCKDEGKATPATKGRSREYLESALDKAKEALGDQFAAMHAAARGRAGGLASGRSRATSIEKSLLVGADRLSALELDDALTRAELWSAADDRKGIKTGGEMLAEKFWAEKCRREAVEKSHSDLPDAAFAVILPGGTKDDEGKTTPRSLRKLPHHTKDVTNGSDNSTVDKALLRNALARLAQTDMPEEAKRAAKRHLDHHAAALLDSSEAAQARKGDPGPSDVHVPRPLERLSTFKSDMQIVQFADEAWKKIDELLGKLDLLKLQGESQQNPNTVWLGELRIRGMHFDYYAADGHERAKVGHMDLVEGLNWKEDPQVPKDQVWLDSYYDPKLWRYTAFHETIEAWLMEVFGWTYDQAHEWAQQLECEKHREHGPTLKADRSGDPGVMIAMRLPAQTAKDISLEGGEPPERLHVTLVYLGRMSSVGPGGMMSAAEAIGAVQDTPILRGLLSGIGRFCGSESSDNKDVLIRLVDVPGLTDLRARLVRELSMRGIPISQAHDFTPHLTLAYVDEKDPMPKRAPPQDVYFDELCLSVNDADTSFPLGQPPLVDFGAEAPGKSPAEVTDCAGPVMQCGELVAMSAQSVEPGDIVEVTSDMSGDLVMAGFSTSTVGAPKESIEKSAEAAHDALLHSTPVPFVGSDAARLVFVSGAPNELELARGEAFVGEDGIAFAKRYLEPLGLSKADVAVGFACPTLPRCATYDFKLRDDNPHNEYIRSELARHRSALVAQLARWPKAPVIAIGKTAHEALGDRALTWVPHPLAARSNEERHAHTVDRKLRRVRKALDEGFVFDDNNSGSTARRLEPLPDRSGEMFVKVAKAAAEKQIVYGVVIDPYEVDTQDEWVPPAEAEATAHDYLRQSRVVGREHLKQDRANVVESFLVEYPTREDYQKAMTLQPHSAYEMPYGDDIVHSGSWIAGVQLDDAGWAAYKRGDITGFSIGGFSQKTRMDKSSMPKVTFVPRYEKPK